MTFEWPQPWALRMSREAGILAAGVLSLVSMAAGAAWLICVNSGTAEDACRHNLRQIDAAVGQWITNAQVTNQTSSHQ